MGIVALISLDGDNDLAPPRHRPIVLSQTKHREHTTGTGLGERRHCLISSRQRSCSPKAQTNRTFIKQTKTIHDRHGPWGASSLPHLIETTISLPQGTDLSFSHKEYTENTRQARAVGNVDIASFNRGNDLAHARHRPIVCL